MPKKANILTLLAVFLVVAASIALVRAPQADGTPPIINPPSIQPASPTSSDTVTVSVVVRDTGGQASGVKNVSIVYSTDNFQSVNITLQAPYNGTTETATAQIPPQSSARVTYYIIAFDNAGNMAISNNFGYDIPAPAYVSTISYIIVGAAIAAGVSFIAFMMLRKPSKSTTTDKTARTDYSNQEESSYS